MCYRLVHVRGRSQTMSRIIFMRSDDGPSLMGSELYSQNFDLEKFREAHVVEHFFLYLETWPKDSQKIPSRRPSSNSARNFGQIPSRPWAWQLSWNFTTRKLHRVLKGYKGGRQYQRADLRHSLSPPQPARAWLPRRVPDMPASLSVIVELGQPPRCHHVEHFGAAAPCVTLLQLRLPAMSPTEGKERRILSGSW